MYIKIYYIIYYIFRMSLDINKLLNALENDDNASIMEIDYAKKASIKNDI